MSTGGPDTSTLILNSQGPISDDALSSFQPTWISSIKGGPSSLAVVCENIYARIPKTTPSIMKDVNIQMDIKKKMLEI